MSGIVRAPARFALRIADATLVLKYNEALTLEYAYAYSVFIRARSTTIRVCIQNLGGIFDRWLRRMGSRWPIRLHNKSTNRMLLCIRAYVHTYCFKEFFILFEASR